MTKEYVLQIIMEKINALALAGSLLHVALNNSVDDRAKIIVRQLDIAAQQSAILSARYQEIAAGLPFVSPSNAEIQALRTEIAKLQIATSHAANEDIVLQHLEAVCAMWPFD